MRGSMQRGKVRELGVISKPPLLSLADGNVSYIIINRFHFALNKAIKPNFSTNQRSFSVAATLNIMLSFNVDMKMSKTELAAAGFTQ